MPDLLLIHPGGKKQVYQSLAESLTALEPPVWCGLIAEYTRRRGYSVMILDTNAEGEEHSVTAERVQKISPALVAVVVYGHQPSASTQHMPAASAICREIKARTPDQKIIMVGGHAAALPEKTLEEEAVDFVCSGEGPKTVVSLLEVIARIPPGRETKPSQPKKDCFAPLAMTCYSSAPDLWYREDAKIKFTFSTPLIQNLDQELPQIAWDLLPMHLYRAHNWHAFGFPDRTPYASIYTTLGCPYHCHFCCIQAPFKTGEKIAGYLPAVNSYRFWSVDCVMHQIDYLVEHYGIRHLKIADEMFVLNEKHVNAICEKLIERNYKLNIWAYARIDTIKPGQLSLLKRAGFHWLAMGIESASEHVRSGVEKSFHQKSIEQTIQQVRDAGIHVIANYVFGLPEDTLETMKETLALAIRLNTEFANFYSAMAYPGSRLYQEAVQNHQELPKSWSGYSQHSRDTLPLATRYLSSREILSFRDRAFKDYFDRPEYLSMIEKTFGAAARQEILEMLSHSLERQFDKITKIQETRSKQLPSFQETRDKQ